MEDIICKTYINLLIFHLTPPFAQTAKTFVESSESNLERNDYEYNAILNSNITYDETVKVIKKLKSKKATGIRLDTK